MRTTKNHIQWACLFLLFFFSVTACTAQRWATGIYSGYASHSFDYFGKEHIHISGGNYSGGEIDYQLDKTFGLKLSYSRQQTTVNAPCFSAVKKTEVERYEAGFTAKKSIVENKLDWTAGLGFGICQILKETDYDDPLKLATSFNAGLQFHVSKYFGLQLMGSLLQFYSKAVPGCNASNTTDAAEYGTVVSQGSITGGIFFSFGK